MYIRGICVFVNTHLKYFKKRVEVIQRQTKANIMNLLYQPYRHKVISKNNFNILNIFNYLPSHIKFLRGPITQITIDKMAFVSIVLEYIEFTNSII